MVIDRQPLSDCAAAAPPHHAMGRVAVVWAALAKRELPRGVLQDLGQQRAIDGLKV
jgi:hypothetical protein